MPLPGRQLVHSVDVVDSMVRGAKISVVPSATNVAVTPALMSTSAFAITDTLSCRMSVASDFNSTVLPASMVSVVPGVSTTFALSDPGVSEALRGFLQDPERGIYRGPYARIRLPFLPVPESWSNPLGWLPPGFRPYRHQAKAFERLSTLNGAAEPTIVTTGTGSGKTEAFLLPLLDHARRARERGEAHLGADAVARMEERREAKRRAREAAREANRQQG